MYWPFLLKEVQTPLFYETICSFRGSRNSAKKYPFPKEKNSDHYYLHCLDLAGFLVFSLLYRIIRFKIIVKVRPSRNGRSWSRTRKRLCLIKDSLWFTMRSRQRLFIASRWRSNSMLFRFELYPYSFPISFSDLLSLSTYDLLLIRNYLEKIEGEHAKYLLFIGISLMK